VTDRGVKAAGIIDTVLDALAHAGTVALYDGTPPNPNEAAMRGEQPLGQLKISIVGDVARVAPRVSGPTRRLPCAHPVLALAVAGPLTDTRT